MRCARGVKGAPLHALSRKISVGNTESPSLPPRRASHSTIEGAFSGALIFLVSYYNEKKHRHNFRQRQSA